jgi:C-terminal processing protease CtpA/Prc
MKGLKKYVWLLLAVLLPSGFLACSDGDEPAREPEVITPPSGGQEGSKKEYYTFKEAYINQFCYDQMSYYYLWWKDIDKSNWMLDDDPIKKVKSIRYEEDRWTAAMEDITPYTDTSATTNGTYGYDFQPYWADASQTYVVAVVKMVYPDSPADKAGLKRGSVIMKMNGQHIENTNEDYSALLSSASLNLSVYDPETKTTKDIKMAPVNMYLDPVLFEKVFDCGGKKVGYLYFNDFNSFDSATRLIEVAKKFKQEGVTELVLDLRYNGGGYVIIEELLASLLAPEANVKNGDLFQTAVYNDTDYAKLLKQYYGEDYANTYFSTEFNWKSGDKEYSYDTSDANIGLNKIYALVTSGSASASEATLVCLMPYLDIEVIGGKTGGKHCAGVVFEAKEYYQDFDDYLAELKKSNVASYNQIMEEWKYYSGWKDYVGKWGLYVMVSTYADKNGNNPCRPNGIVPDIEIKDNPQEPYPLGDDREAMLRVALTEAGYTDFTPLPEAKSRALTSSLGEAIPMKSEGKRMLLKPERPMNFSSRSLRMK